MTQSESNSIIESITVIQAMALSTPQPMRDRIYKEADRLRRMALEGVPVRDETLEKQIERVVCYTNACQLYGPADALRDAVATLDRHYGRGKT